MALNQHPLLASTSASLAAHPWIPAGPTDARSPCPALNALANHNILYAPFLPPLPSCPPPHRPLSNHTGRNLTYSALTAALEDAYGLSPTLAALLTGVGIATCGRPLSAQLDLDGLSKHGVIEHDASLSHGDAPPGSSLAPNTPDVARIDLALGQGKTVSLEDLARARVRAERKLDKKLDAVHAQIGQGEVALTLLAIGDGRAADAARVRAWWAREELPYALGWTPPVRGSVGLWRTRRTAGEVAGAMRRFEGIEDLD